MSRTSTPFGFPILILLGFVVFSMRPTEPKHVPSKDEKQMASEADAYFALLQVEKRLLYISEQQKAECLNELIARNNELQKHHK